MSHRGEEPPSVTQGGGAPQFLAGVAERGPFGNAFVKALCLCLQRVYSVSHKGSRRWELDFV